MSAPNPFPPAPTTCRAIASRPLPSDDEAFLQAVALLGPGIAAHMVAVLLPEARCIFRDQLDTCDPFRALPCVQARHDQSGRSAVLGRNRLAIVVRRDQCILREKVLERQI